VRTVRPVVAAPGLPDRRQALRVIWQQAGDVTVLDYRRGVRESGAGGEAAG
jgi:hypothetical protein